MICLKCDNLVSCVCAIKVEHKKGCRFRRAAELSVELACEHGFQACLNCDSCDCGHGAAVGVQ